MKETNDIYELLKIAEHHKIMAKSHLDEMDKATKKANELMKLEED